MKASPDRIPDALNPAGSRPLHTPRFRAQTSPQLDLVIVEPHLASWQALQAVGNNERIFCFTWSAVKGFRIYPIAPASIACFTCSSLDSVVIITTGAPSA